MDSLESRMDRLSPDQRKEMEDFVDFLLTRSGQALIPPDVSRNPSPVLRVAPPPLTMVGPAPVVDAQTAGPQKTGPRDDRNLPAAGDVPASFQEIGGSAQDWISHDYMDYGRFERLSSSPATESVKRIKRKIRAKEGQNNPHLLLDWVD